jgi:DNA end-binding protein Ku
MAPRSIWNGTIAFGLVSVPVKLFTATESHTISFHEVHVRDGARIEHRRICPKEDKEVPYDDVVKGFEVSEDKYVVLDDEEIKAAAGSRGKTIWLDEFVDVAEIDPVVFDKTYYAGAGGEPDAYRLLRDALARSERAGIGRFTFHDREYLVALRAYEDTLALHTLHFADELVEAKDLDIARASKKPAPREVQMAGKLVDSLDADFDPADYEDSYRDAVVALVKRKAKGEEIDLTAQEEPEQGDDLAAALEASLG